MASFFDWLRSRNKDIRYDDPGLTATSDKVGTIEVPDKLTDKNAFSLANTVTEIYHPIDFIADRASKVRFFIAKNGKEVAGTELNRFLKDIYPFFSFSDLIYQYIFSYLADGNALQFVTVPESLNGEPSVSNITRLDILNPAEVYISEYSNIGLLRASQLKDIIKKIKYSDGGFRDIELNIDHVRIDNIDMSRREDSQVLSRSPLFKAYRPINNLLATYSARYNIYVNNGAAGYLVKKAVKTSEIEQAVNPATRDEILADINERKGLTGKRQLWGISSIPIEFINTMSTIKDLLPFEETLEDSIKIAGVFQLPPELIPRKDQSTFSNKAEAERSVWENAIMSMLQVACQNITKALRIDKVGCEILPDYSTVSALRDNEAEIQDTRAKLIQNELTLYEKGVKKYNEMLLAIGEEPIQGGDKYIFDMTKTPYAVKLGVGGTQSMQMILSDPLITSESKKNILVVIFGLTEEEAKKVIQ